MKVNEVIHKVSERKNVTNNSLTFFEKNNSYYLQKRFVVSFIKE